MHIGVLRDSEREMLPVRILIMMAVSVGYLYLSGLWASAVSTMHPATRFVHVFRLLLPAVGATLAASIGYTWTRSRMGSLLFWLFAAAWVFILIMPVFGLGALHISMAAIPGVMAALGWFSGSGPVRDRASVDAARVLGLLAIGGITVSLHHVFLFDWSMQVADGPVIAFLRLCAGAAALLLGGALFEFAALPSPLGFSRNRFHIMLTLGIWLVPLLVAGYELLAFDAIEGIVEMGSWPPNWRAYYAPIMLSILGVPVGSMVVRLAR